MSSARSDRPPLRISAKILFDLVIPLQPPRVTHVRCNGGNQIKITESSVRQKHIRSLKRPLQRAIPETEGPQTAFLRRLNEVDKTFGAQQANMLRIVAQNAPDVPAKAALRAPSRHQLRRPIEPLRAPPTPPTPWLTNKISSAD